MNYTGEDAKFQAGVESLRQLTDSWVEIYELVVATLLNQEVIAEKRVLKVIILLTYRTEIMEAIFDLASLLFLHAKTDVARKKMGEVVELIDDELERDADATVSAQFLN
jgi:hypothetical protein